jgi:hypothetical protein
VNPNHSIEAELSITIDGVEEAAIAAYFSRLNNGEFLPTAELFSERGCLKPPFETPIEGREAIAEYLAKEARGMRFCPESGILLSGDNDLIEYHIQGKVQTNYFTINVSWLMQLNMDTEIVLVEVKLLAALEELLKFSK